MKIKNLHQCVYCGGPLLNYRTMRYAISVYIIYLQNVNINNIKIHNCICLTGALVRYIKKRIEHKITLAPTILQTWRTNRDKHFIVH